ncbi:hypothetical protein [Deferrisoma camini]|uniref:hypothetical protein n=1 Tax=Deferrisoma camini TaxID=1035120 RepID=UPI00046CC95B|nr:hypothetical protein [Deferrisoma camini]
MRHEQAREMAGALGWAAGVLEYHVSRGGGVPQDAAERLLEQLRDKAARAGLDLSPRLRRETRR